MNRARKKNASRAAVGSEGLDEQGAGTPSGELFVVATPIGNLEDITMRALRVLQSVDRILAEDTRRTKVLCEKYQIATLLESFHAHTSEARLQAVLERLQSGAKLALVSDAGTPLVSDPGAELVAAAVARGVRVTPIPGPSAVLTALMCAGLPTDRFRFLGFVPRTRARRQRLWASVRSSADTSVVFEAPNRLRSTLEELQAQLPEGTRIAVCRELTKLHEEVYRGNVTAVLDALPQRILGETVILIDATEVPLEQDLTGPQDAQIAADLEQWRTAGLSSRDLVQKLIQHHGFSKNAAYERVLASKAD